MVKFKDLLPFVGGGLFSKDFRQGVKNFFTGTPEKHDRVSTLLPEQQDLFNQLQAALAGQGAGGAFGQSADYYRAILEDNPELMQQFFAPEMRKFKEQIIPGLSEQFAGMGSGALSSSGFRNAAVNAGTDLSERLGTIRANLKQQAAQGLSGLGQYGLGNFSQDVITQQGTPGFFQQAMPAITQAGIGYLTGGPPGAIAGATNALSQSPYAGQGGGIRRQGY